MVVDDEIGRNVSQYDLKHSCSAGIAYLQDKRYIIKSIERLENDIKASKRDIDDLRMAGSDKDIKSLYKRLDKIEQAMSNLKDLIVPVVDIVKRVERLETSDKKRGEDIAALVVKMSLVVAGLGAAVIYVGKQLLTILMKKVGGE